MDKRAIKTKQSIQNAFFELIKDKPLKDIRVVDICKTADINRSSFYAHYEDLPCLVRSLRDEIVREILGACEMYLFDTDTKAMVAALLNSIKENKYLFSLMYDYKELDAWEICKRKINERTIPIWQEESGLPEEELRLLLEYMYGGVFRLIEIWCEGNVDIDVDRFQELFEGVVKYGIYNFIYTK